MPKSRTRKNHKKRVAARNMKLKGEAKKMQETIDAYKKPMLKKWLRTLK